MFVEFQVRVEIIVERDGRNGTTNLMEDECLHLDQIEYFNYHFLRVISNKKKGLKVAISVMLTLPH